jgi:Zn-dependent protease with chaperone function
VYYLIAAIECLGVGFLALICAGLVCLPASRLVARAIRQRHPGTIANILFAFRLLPAGIAATLSLAFALPAYLMFEPHPSNDYVGPLQIILGVSGAAMFAIMIFRMVHALHSSSMVEEHWLARSRRVHIPGLHLPAYSVKGIPSLFVVTGILRPRVFVSREILQEFSAGEMSAAAAHEMAHVRSFDNLKQLLLEITRPPAWLLKFGISDESWADATEHAADHFALSVGNPPLQLASALLKVVKLRSSFVAHHFPGMHLVPAHGRPRLETRVTHLIAMTDNPGPRPHQFSSQLVYGFALTGITLFVICYAATAPVVLRFAEHALDMLF